MRQAPPPALPARRALLPWGPSRVQRATAWAALALPTAPDRLSQDRRQNDQNPHTTRAARPLANTSGRLAIRLPGDQP